MNSQCQESQGLNNMIEPTDVVLLMKDDIFLLLLTQIIGKIDLRLDKANYKGRFDIVSYPDIIPKGDCNPDHSSNLQVGNTAVEHHDCHTNEPCNRKIHDRFHSTAYIHLYILRSGVLRLIVILFSVTGCFKLDLRQSRIDDCTTRRGRVWNYADRTLNRNRD